MPRFLLPLLLISMLPAFFSCAGNQTMQEPEKDRLIIMTYNVHHCNPPGKPGVIDVDAIATVIKQEGATIVAVQEVDVNTHRSGKINEAEQLAQKAGYPYYHFGKAMDYDGGQYGVLILSKYPLSDTQTHALPMNEPGKFEQRVLAAATLSLPEGKQIRFGCTHLEAFNKESRLLQIKEISRIAEESAIPFIVAGDLNAIAGSEVIDVLDAQFTRTCDDCPATFGEDGNTGAIDFIAFQPRDAFDVLSHRVIQDNEASDHMPVIANLQFR